MKFIIVILFLFSTSVSFAKCRALDPEDGETKDRPQTFMGGCRYVSPVLKFGYSSEYYEFIGIGVILPFDQYSDWEGGFKENGVSLTASKYEGSEIYDIGFAKRDGWVFMTKGFDVGLSYRDANESMKGVYASYSMIGLVLVRYLESNDESQFSIEVGFKL